MSSAGKYHINMKTGRANICRARYSCPFGGSKDHFSTKEEAAAEYEQRMKKLELAEARRRAPMGLNPKTGPNDRRKRAPVVVDPLPFDEPYFASWELLEATDVEPLGYYEDDGYSTFQEAYPRKAIELTLGLEEKDWPESLTELVAEHEEEWSNTASWDVEYGYYPGETPQVSVPQSMSEKLIEWYWDQPNANDRQGVLEHVRSKGFETAGLRPVDAVKKLLREENGMDLKWVNSARDAHVAAIDFSEVRINKRHYSEVTPRKPEPQTSQAKPIEGIVHHSPKEGYRLLDGYHRLKHGREKAGKTSGTFIVIR